MPEFGVLGPLQVRDGSAVLDLPGRRRRNLLVRLLVAANRPVAAEQLIEDVWDSSPPQGASQTLQSHISALRRLLGANRIHHASSGYSIEITDGELDAYSFETEREAGISASGSGDFERASALLGTALGRWRGTALVDVTDSAWSVPFRTRLDELRTTCIEAHLDVLLVLGRNEEAVVLADAAAREQPLREGLWHALMVALYRCGRQAEALRAYERLRRTLDEIGIAPSPALSALDLAILEQSPELDWQPPGAGAAAGGRGGILSTGAQLVPRKAPMPTGIVTLLFTDIEGSTRMWEEHAASMSEALVRHDQLVRTSIAHHAGHVFKTVGDAFCAAFPTSSGAVRAAMELQEALAGEVWPEGCDLRVRVALHTGECEERGGDYFGSTVNRVARLVSSGWGGQTLLSRVTAELVRGSLPASASLKDLGILRLKDLGQPEQVFELDVEGMTKPFPPLGLVERGYDELPAEITALVGRERLVDALLEEVRAQRLVTLTGPGGVGKTRLAARVANVTQQEFPDGVRFVDLSVIPAEGSTADVILSALHGAPAPGELTPKSVVRVLGPARLLLVLDNAEHQVAQVRSLVAAILQNCHWVHVLCTSRQALGLAEEHRFEVPQLEVPSASSPDLRELQRNPAARLFALHARMVDHDFSVNAANAASVADICRTVGGLPLAIELAARQLDVVTVDELAHEARSHQLLSRLSIESRLEQRLGSVATSLQWSLNLLSEAEKVLFASLGVFAGTFTRDQALDLVEARSSNEVAKSFDRLVRLSLITRDSPGSARFRLFEPTKEFATSLLDPGKRRSLFRRHARVMRDVAERFSPLLRTEREAEACAQLSADFPDYRQAVAWFFEHSVEDAARMVIALCQFCQFQMLPEANEWATRLTKVLDDNSPSTTAVFGAAAMGSWFGGDYEEAIALGERAIEAAPSPRDPSALWAHTALLDAKAYSGRALENFEHIAAIDAYGKQSGDKFWQINSLGFKTLGWLLVGDVPGAMSRSERAIDLARELNNPDCTHWAMHCHGRVLAMSNPDAACEAFEAAMDAAGSVGSRWNLCLDLVEWSSLKRQLNDLPRAAQGLLELLELLVASGNRSQRSQFYLEAAQVLAAQGDVETAFMIMTARAGMPIMPMPPGAPKELSVPELEAALGSKAAPLRARAGSLTANDLVVLCRSHLEGIVGTQRLSTPASTDRAPRERSGALG